MTLSRIIRNKRLSLLKVNNKSLTFFSTSKAADDFTPLRKRDEMINVLKTNEANKTVIDLLIVGGGATGAGAALDARLRGLNVVCIEMEDFSSGTSSRSTKLIWGGSRYLVQAFINLLNPDLRLVRSPVQTVTKFLEDFKMVLNCHRERKFLLDTQPHLTNWLPIAVPLTKWVQWPPPFGFPPAALGAFGLFPLFFKFYDSLTGFTCPPSHIMTPSRAKRKFPQLANNKIKYSPIFYEGQHDDARTNLAIAQTAVEEGAIVINYCQLQNLIYADNSGKVVGGVVRDLKTNTNIEIRSNSILFAGGPFTDSLRKIEDKNCKNSVNGASGIHIVLPSYFAPSGIGLVDMNTSDGRFLFFLPWMGHVVVGTTDRKCEISTRPEPEESEIKWLLNEASKFLSPELSLRREDVLSAWSGIRPLAMDPHASSTAAASRDHIISVNPKTNTIFIAGGKWTTYREMAEDAIDKVIEVAKLKDKVTKKCSTLTTPLIGFKGYSSNLHIRLIQEYGIASSVAKRLSTAYGGRAHEVLRIAKHELGMIGRGDRLVPGYPYIEAEVIYAVRHEWALTADDIIARRTRLAFLNKEAAIRAIPKVVNLMGNELSWDDIRRKQESKACLEYLKQFGGKIPVSDDVGSRSVRLATLSELKETFMKFANKDKMDQTGLMLASEILGWSILEHELPEIMTNAGSTDGTITYEQFSKWWNSANLNPMLVNFQDKDLAGTGTLFG